MRTSPATNPPASTLGYHVVLRLGDDRVIAPSRSERRRWARRLAELTRELPILAWKIADTHLHLLVLGKHEVVTELLRRLRIWVHSLGLGVPLELQRRKPLAGQSHLESVFGYVLRQDDHHSIDVDRFQDSSAVLDILGLRTLSPKLAERVRERYPRLRHDQLYKHLNVEAVAEDVHGALLVEATCAALGIDALGRDEAGMRARRAAVAAGKGLGVNSLAELLDLTPQTVCRLAKGIVPAEEVRAVRLQMGIRAQSATRPAMLVVREPTGAAYVA